MLTIHKGSNFEGWRKSGGNVILGLIIFFLRGRIGPGTKGEPRKEVEGDSETSVRGRTSNFSGSVDSGNF